MMWKTMVVMSFSGVYEEQSFWRQSGKEKGPALHWLDCRGLPGTNCYCDEEARAQLRERLRAFPAEGVHFLDNGNYQYISTLWLERLEEPFDLLVLDHHTDVQPPAFGGILSCGGWIRQVMEENPWVRQVYVAGPPAEAVRQAEEERSRERQAGGEGGFCEGQIQWISEEEMRCPAAWQGRLRKEGEKTAPRPLYISVDKDILAQDYADTNWDQGSLDRDTLLRCLREAAALRPLAGMDVCGENPETEAGEQRRRENEKTNALLTNLPDCAIYERGRELSAP